MAVRRLVSGSISVAVSAGAVALNFEGASSFTQIQISAIGSTGLARNVTVVLSGGTTITARSVRLAVDQAHSFTSITVANPGEEDPITVNYNLTE